MTARIASSLLLNCWKPMLLYSTN